jgi:hypothetical protein
MAIETVPAEEPSDGVETALDENHELDYHHLE